MKLSFSLPSSKSSKHTNKPDHGGDDDGAGATKHLITEFDPSKPPPLSQPKTLIPPIQNQWRPLKKPKMNNLLLPLTEPQHQHSLAFEPDTAAAAEPDSDISYGLNLRRDAKQTEDNAHDDDAAAPRRRFQPEAMMLQKLKDDLEKLPDDQGFDEFKDIPVEGFGAALLAGYGWSEGMGIGKNPKEDVKVVEYKRRAGKEGLGFVGDAPVSRHQKKEGGAAENGKEKKEKEKEKVVRIVGGRDAGLKGSVVSRIGDDFLVLKLVESGEQVKVKMGDVAELGSVEEERCLRKLKDLKIRRRNEDKGAKSKRGRDGVEDMRGDRGREEQGKKQASWLTSHIRVRVVSRDLKGGRLYLKKGEILDVVGPATCDLSLDDSREIIQGVSQDLLETVIPRRGGPVLVLSGKHKGAFGSLVEKDLDREIAIVRDADTHELLKVKLEQVAEYMGDPSLLGH
ncbi:protein MOS2 [Lotus japonicus]|nr:protein MOS2 [Lotus japonicus]XP_057445274.1 protein MOS2 [Lotus japonicus]XP_057445275.1 protein MOS2 [Lotus japonicus]